MIDLDAFELHTVDNWHSSSEERRKAIVDGNVERVRRGVDDWNHWVVRLVAWAKKNDISVCIYFDDSEWVGNTNFAGFRFTVSVSFLRAQFIADPAGRGDVDFSDVLLRRCELCGSKVLQYPGSFQKYKISGYADFSNTEFNGPYLTFANATFSGDFSFESAKVRGCPSNFVGADFCGDAVFNYTEFCRSVDFGDATFKGGQALLRKSLSIARGLISRVLSFLQALLGFVDFASKE